MLRPATRAFLAVVENRFYMHVSEINIYPIKSLKGIGLPSATVYKRGLECDRCWVVVDATGKFLTQRELPRMATIAVERNGGGLNVSANGSGTLAIEPLGDGPRVETAVWDRSGQAITYDIDTNEWFSDALGTAVELRYMPEDAGRPVKSIGSKDTDRTGFADAYPLLLANEASMEDLNRRIEEADMHAGRLPAVRRLPINRFRPNIVISGAEAWAEDGWTKIRVGKAVFRVVKPSDRCVVTTTDQVTGERGKEPLKTLATFRMSKDVFPARYESWGLPANSVLFGENLIPDTPGATINVGDAVEVLEARS